MTEAQGGEQPTLATRTKRGYSLSVAANSAHGIGVPENKGGHRLRAVFLCPQHGKPFMGGPCGEPSGSPVPLYRYANSHGSAHPIGVGCGNSIRYKGIFAMTPRRSLRLATPSRRARANRHRRLALAALKTNSSVSVRLRRYQRHIDIARQLEVQGVRHA